MEIDFLGLNSSKSIADRQRSEDAFSDSGNGEVETSLSLSTSSSLDSQREILNFCEKQKQKQTWEFHYKQGREQPSLVVVPTPVYPSSRATAFLYDLNDRGFSELPPEAPASLAMLYASCPKVFKDNLQEKLQADTNLFVAGTATPAISEDARICKGGYTPTVAMARRATLARFLEKRLHRMNKVKASHLIRTNSEVCNHKRNSSLIRP